MCNIPEIVLSLLKLVLQNREWQSTVGYLVPYINVIAQSYLQLNDCTQTVSDDQSFSLTEISPHESKWKEKGIFDVDKLFFMYLF